VDEKLERLEIEVLTGLVCSLERENRLLRRRVAFLLRTIGKGGNESSDLS
jgi:hypothetical protein